MKTTTLAALAAPPTAVCATRQGLHLRKERGVKRSA